MTSVLVLKIYDLAGNELADITPISLEKSLERKFGQARVMTIQAPAAHTLLTSIADDGYPNLRRGNRRLLVWENDTIVFHGRIWTIERNGNGTENLVTITAQMPLAELGYDSNEQAGRIVRGSTAKPTAGTPFGVYDGNFIQPLFSSSVADQDEISGPDLVLQVLTNTQNTGSESDPTPGEGPLPIDLTTGTFDLEVPPAVDLSVIDSMDWPVLVGDFIQQLVQTGVCDVDERPVDPTEDIAVANPYLMSALTAVSALGTDKSDTVHFDYWTGSKNASACRHVDDFSTINNKLYDYLGPRQADGIHWRGNITPSIAPTDLATAIAASRALYGGPADVAGQWMSIRIFDSVGGESSSRPLYLALWNAEQGLRVEPRAMLYMTPASDSAALFDAPADFDIGDLIGSNVGDALGVTLADVQRVYGWTATWSREGVKSLSELVTSADEAS